MASCGVRGAGGGKDGPLQEKTLGNGSLMLGGTFTPNHIAKNWKGKTAFIYSFCYSAGGKSGLGAVSMKNRGKKEPAVFLGLLDHLERRRGDKKGGTVHWEALGRRARGAPLKKS